MSDPVVPDPWPADTPLRVGILLFDGVEPLDAIGPAQVFWSLSTGRGLVADCPAIEVLLVAETAEPVRAGHGLVVHPNATYADVGALDVLIVPGGSGNDPEVVIPSSEPAAGRRYQATHEPTLAFVAAQAASVQITASVCTGTFILGAAGLLDGRRGSTHWSARDELGRFMAARGEAFTIEAERVVDDGDVVTGGGVSSGIDVALHIVDRVLGPACREVAAAIIERETPAESVAPVT
jgi:transcriptional regulator GlxA family with amidase domain